MRHAVRLPLEQLEPYLWSMPEREGSSETDRIDWAGVFRNPNPVEIEVGFGKGLFLINAAEENPNVNFFGIELERKYYFYVANRVAKRNLANVRVANADARAVLRDHVASGSVQAIHVYFPDPWWKKRHHKRRVFTDELVKNCETLLMEGGRFHVATDVGEYFEIIQELLRSRDELKELPAPDGNEPQHDMDYLTNFERKKRKEGKPIYRALYQRVVTV